MGKLREVSLALSALLAAFFLRVFPALADEKITPFGIKGDTAQAAEQLASKVKDVVNLVAGFAGVVLFAVLVFAGYKFMTSADNPNEHARSKSILLGALGGALLIFTAWLLTQAIIGKLSASAGG
ncbi:hypothetical protein [Ammonifex thiophilus]|uniref:Uncharacterized protein n=1 Tax=Ammonifex thiophilus TaxID=444093 RepID=A0A3D8P308_9THEO|nr:hypothetical protein [Ammonifex thiophilus]RDV81224.1 hypothetical protein DXX99_09580 [Ammonifex thiophilus]